MEFSDFQFAHTSLVLSLGTTGKSGSVSFIPGYPIFMDIVKIPEPSFLQSEESQNP